MNCEIRNWPKWEFSHTFWFLKDSLGTRHILSGLPTGDFPHRGYMHLCNTRGNVGHVRQDNEFAADSWSDIGTGDVCSRTSDMLIAALAHPQTQFRYDPAVTYGWNCHTLSWTLAQKAGFVQATPPPYSRGWGKTMPW